MWLMKEVGRATQVRAPASDSLCSHCSPPPLLQASQKDSNFRLEEKLRDTNNWRGELQAEMDAVTQETEQLLETRSSCRHSCSPAANSCLLPQVPAAGQHRADPAPAARHHGVPDGAGGAACGGQGAGPGEYWPVIGQQEQHSSLIGQVEVSLEKEVDTVRSQQGKMRDLLVTVSSSDSVIQMSNVPCSIGRYIFHVLNYPPPDINS